MITIENTSYGYKSNPLIFNNISLEIGNGIYGLLGENGVGKTTLMHLICGLLFPKNGKCSIDGRNTAERQPEGLARYFFLPEEMQMPTESIVSFGKGEILLNRSLDEISNRLLFARTDILPAESIYSEQDLSGHFSILPNEDGEENTPDIELLYKAVLQQPEKIQSMFQ